MHESLALTLTLTLRGVGFGIGSRDGRAIRGFPAGVRLRVLGALRRGDARNMKYAGGDCALASGREQQLMPITG